MPNKKPNPDLSLRHHLVDLLKGGNAHASFDQAVDGIPPNLRGQKPPAFPHSPWMLLEHLRIALWDILEFSRDQKHVSPKWPEGYWPADTAPSSAAWDTSIKNFRKDLKAMEALVTNPKTDLYARIPWGDGQTILRQALLVADHNAYHVAQLIDVRRLLGAWPNK
jgi:DinB superfamily